MKKLLTLCLLAVTMCVAAQEQPIKSVAVPEIVDKTGQVSTVIKQLLQKSLIQAVARTPGYECIDMSINFQDLNQTPKSASYLLIAEVSPFKGDNVMVSANLLDAETAQLINTIPMTIVSTQNLEKLKETFSQIAKKLLSPED